MKTNKSFLYYDYGFTLLEIPRNMNVANVIERELNIRCLELENGDEILKILNNELKFNHFINKIKYVKI